MAYQLLTTVSIACFVLVCGCKRVTPEPAAPAPVAPVPDVEQMIRQAVSVDGVGLAIPFEGPYAFCEVVVIPSEIEIAYREKPDAVVGVLVEIAERGPPPDAMRAVVYAIALVDNPNLPTLAVRLFKEDTYDELDRDWGIPPRQHWNALLKRLRAEHKLNK